MSETELNIKDATFRSICAQYGQEYKVVGTIHSDDYLYKFIRNLMATEADAIREYFADGLKSAELLRKIVIDYLGSEGKDCRILEFASGYGRVTRHLKNVLAGTNITCSDIHEAANEFIRHELGFPVMTSTAVPTDFRTTQLFELTFVLSLFSHLPAKSWGSWLASLFATVAPGGFLVFTTHGRLTAKNMGIELPSEGFWFDSVSDQGDLDVADYGTSIVTSRYAFGQVNGLKNARIVDFIEGFWWAHQDLYVVQRTRTTE